MPDEISWACSFRTGNHRHNAGHVVLGFPGRGNAAVLANGVRSCVIGCQCMSRVAELLEQHCEKARLTVKVLQGVAQINARVPRRCGHHLPMTRYARAGKYALTTGLSISMLARKRKAPSETESSAWRKPGCCHSAELLPQSPKERPHGAEERDWQKRRKESRWPPFQSRRPQGLSASPKQSLGQHRHYSCVQIDFRTVRRSESCRSP
jgi:hypothetical protein